MLDALVLSHSVAENANALSPTLVCSWTGGGLDAAWVDVAGELDIATVPQLDRMLRESQVEARLVVLDLRELEFMTAAARTRSLVTRCAHGRPVGGWCSCVAE